MVEKLKFFSHEIFIIFIRIVSEFYMLNFTITNVTCLDAAACANGMFLLLYFCVCGLYMLKLMHL